MSNSRIIVYLTLGILLTLSAHILLDLSSKISPTEAFKITVFKPDTKFKSLTILAPGKPSVTLAKQEGAWSVVEPLPGKADEREILKLLDSLTVVPWVESISDAELLRLGRGEKDFHLDDPLLTVKCNTENGEKELLFGLSTPSGDGVYAEIKSEPNVYVLSYDVYKLFARQANEFRAHRLIVETPDHVRVLDVKLGSVPLGSFSKKGDFWVFDNGMKTSNAKIIELITAICQLEAKDFIWPVDAAGSLAEIPQSVLSGYGLDGEGTIKVTIGGNDGRETRFAIGKEAGDGTVYALTDFGRSIVTIDGDIKEKLLNGADTLVDNHVFPYELDKITSLKLSYNEEEFLFKKGTDRLWRFESPISAEVDLAQMTTLLTRILELTHEDAVAGGIEVAVNEEAESAAFSKVLLFKDGGIEDLRSKEIIKISPDTIKRIVVGGAIIIEPQSVVYDSSRRLWSAERPAGVSKVNEEAIKSILSVFESLVAEKVVKVHPEPKDLRAYGLEDPYLIISIDRSKFDVPRKNLLIGNETEGGRYATIGVSDAIFILPTPILERLKYDIISAD